MRRAGSMASGNCLSVGSEVAIARYIVNHKGLLLLAISCLDRRLLENSCLESLLQSANFVKKYHFFC